MELPTDILSIIISYLDYGDDPERAEVLMEGLSVNEVAIIRHVWEASTVYEQVFSEDSDVWFMNKKHHRIGGPAFISHVGRYRREWWVNDKQHRDERGYDGHILPAVIFDGGKQWWTDGVLIREEFDETFH